MRKSGRDWNSHTNSIMRKVEEMFGRCEQEMWLYSFGSEKNMKFYTKLCVYMKTHIRAQTRIHSPLSLSLSLTLTHTHTHTQTNTSWKKLFLEVRLSCENKMTKSLFPSPYHSTSRTCSSFSELHFYKHEKEGHKNPLEATSPPLALLYGIYFF